MSHHTRRPRAPRWSLPVVAACAAALLAAGCGGSDSSSTSAGGLGGSDSGSGSGGSKTGPVRIGALSTLEGPFAALGEDSMKGVKVALLERGGKLEGTGVRDGVSGATVAGRPIELSIEGSDATPNVAVEKTRKLVEQDKVDVFVGPLSGDEGIAVKDYAKQHLDRTFVNGLSAAQNMTLRDPAPNVFRFGGDGAMWTAGLGTYAHDELGYRKVATIAEDYSYPYDQVGGFLTEFCAAGGTVAKRVWFPLGTKDLASYVTQLPKDLDAVFFAMGGTDAVNFVKQYDQFTGRKTPLLGGTTAVDGSVLTGLGKRADGIVSAGPVPQLDIPEYRSYAAALAKAFPKTTPDAVNAYYYVATKAALMALAEVKGDLTGGQKAFQAALSKLSFTAPFGPVKLDENRQGIVPMYLQQVKDGQQVKIGETPSVDATLNMPRAAYIAKPAFDRDNPKCG